MPRQHDLENGIRESYALIHEYKGILRFSPDPKEKAHARQAMTEQWELIRDSLVPYQRIVGADFPEDIRQIVACFQVQPATPPQHTASVSSQWFSLRLCISALKSCF